MNTPRILIAEDDTVQREILHDILRDAGYDADAFGLAREAFAALEKNTYDLLLTDLRMPEMDGLDLLREALRIRPELSVVVMTAYATVKTAVTAMKEGACDYLAKPFDKEELLVVIDKALQHYELRRENRQLRALVSDATALGNIVGQSPAMQKVFDMVRRATAVSSTVLIQGESGTGKEMVARHIHFAVHERNNPS